MKNLNAKFLIGNALFVFLPHLKEQKTVFQYHVWFEPQTWPNIPLMEIYINSILLFLFDNHKVIL